MLTSWVGALAETVITGETLVVDVQSTRREGR
jgi:hypothetical protein